MVWKLLTRPNALIACPDYKRSAHTPLNRTKLIRNGSPGELSINARMKIKSAIRWLIASSDAKEVYEKKHKKKVKYLVSAATLTFADNMQDDNKARQILSKWLEMASYRWDAKQWVWKAEAQERGAIHFHLVFNVYIPYAELNFTWNRALTKAGLKLTSKNGTDIHAVLNCKSLEGYLVDYLTNKEKSKDRRKIKGRLWGCSRDLAQAGKRYMLLDADELVSLSNELHRYSLRQNIEAKGEEVPEFLNMIGYWMLPLTYYKDLPECDIKTTYFEEIAALKVRQQKQFFPPAYS